MYEYKAKLLKVIDGDTATVDVDLGLYNHEYPVDIRFASINADEKETVLGQKAIAFVTDWFAKNPEFVLTTILTKAGPDKKERYGRILGTFTALTGGVSLNQQLHDAGLAVYYNGVGKKPSVANT